MSSHLVDVLSPVGLDGDVLSPGGLDGDVLSPDGLDGVKSSYLVDLLVIPQTGTFALICIPQLVEERSRP